MNKDNASGLTTGSNMSIKIDKGVAPPTSGRGRGSKYPFADMKAGDSFRATTLLHNTIITSWYAWKRRHPNHPNAKLHGVSARDGNGYRFWLVERS